MVTTAEPFLVTAGEPLVTAGEPLVTAGGEPFFVGEPFLVTAGEPSVTAGGRKPFFVGEPLFVFAKEEVAGGVLLQHQWTHSWHPCPSSHQRLTQSEHRSHPHLV